MSRLVSDAPDLAISPDGAWLARLEIDRLLLYDLTESRDKDRGAPAGPAPMGGPVVDVDLLRWLPGPPAPGQIGFIGPERLLLSVPCGDPAPEDGEGPPPEDGPTGIAALLLTVPDLQPVSSLHVPELVRVLCVGPAGVVIAPLAPGAEVISVRGGELALDRTFLRGDVLSATPAPDRRWLFEQRGAYEIWDPTLRRGVSRLTLAPASRQPIIQVGFAAGGRLIWTLGGGVPLTVEMFRFSDRLRLFELIEPGRALRADVAPGRLVVALDTGGEGGRFLDVDVASQEIRRLEQPPGDLLSFVVRPVAASPEILALIQGRDETQAPVLHRIPLERLPGARDNESTLGIDPPTSGRGRPVSPFLVREGTERGPSVRPADVARPAEPERPRPLARPGEMDRSRQRGERPFAPGPGLDPEAPAGGLAPEERAADPDRSRQRGPAPPEPRPDPRAEASPDARPDTRPDARPDPRPDLRSTRQRRKGGGRGPAAWQWDLIGWARGLRGDGEVFGDMPLCPPLAALSSRLGLQPIAQQILALLYAGQRLLGSHPRGMWPAELADLLGAVHDEGLVLSELLPGAPLRRLDLLVGGAGEGRGRRDGRVRLQPPLLELLDGEPSPVVTLALSGAPRAGGRLEPGLYVTPRCAAPALSAFCGRLSQPVVRLDALKERRPLPAIRRALRRALLHGAVVLLEGLGGISFPVFAPDSTALELRRLLATAGQRVPVVLSGSPVALAGLGLDAQLIHLPPAGAQVPAPALPSAPLPQGTAWRPPRPTGQAAFPPDGAPYPGRLEQAPEVDLRAAVMLLSTASPDDYARAAHLCARDGAVLSLEVPLTPARAAVLATLMRQLPVWVTAHPPGEGEELWPPELAMF